VDATGLLNEGGVLRIVRHGVISDAAINAVLDSVRTAKSSESGDVPS
jgi:hypothetical protein